VTNFCRSFRSFARVLTPALTLALAAAWGLAPNAVRGQTPAETGTPIRATLAIEAAKLLTRDFANLAAERAALSPLPDGAECHVAERRDCWTIYPWCQRCNPWPEGLSLEDHAVLLDRLAEVAWRHPDGVSDELKDWIAGRQVLTWAYAGRMDRARRAAEVCQATDWWCEALLATVDHWSAEYVSAERRFRRALSLMPPVMACYWNEVVLYGDTLGKSTWFHGVKAHDCSIAPHESFWILADPLFMVPGNDRLTEHLARHVDIRVHDQDLRAGGAQDGLLGSPGIAGHSYLHHTHYLRRHFPNGYVKNGIYLARLYSGQGFIVTSVSPAMALRAPYELLAPVGEGRTENYWPPYGPVQAIPVQTGFFLDDGRPQLVVRAASPDPAARLNDGWHLFSWNGTNWRDVRVEAADSVVVARLFTPWEPQLISLEALHDGGAYRARSGTNPPESTGQSRISSLVLLGDDDSEPESLSEAARRMVAGTDVPRTMRGSAYWEIYIPDVRQASFELTVVPPRQVGFIDRLLGRTNRASRVRWQEQLRPADGVVRRSLGLDLHTLDPGDYLVELVVRLDDGSALKAGLRMRLLENTSRRGGGDS
jgi:hypothetical protein